MMNQVLVGRAVRMLNINPQERVLDLFCGIGNFTLPIATLAREVWGIEGSDVLCKRAQANVHRNDIQTPMHFRCVNLFEVILQDLLSWETLKVPNIVGHKDLATEVPSCAKILGKKAWKFSGITAIIQKILSR